MSVEVTNAAIQRILWRDIARAIGITLVVYGHVLRGLVAAGLIQHGSLLASSDYALYTFHMPLFFLLSGLNVDRSIQKGRRRFLQDKLWLVAYPYLLWSLIQGIIQIRMASFVNTPMGWSHLLTIGWMPIAQFWFLYALFFCHLLAVLFSAQLRFLVPIAFMALAHFCWSAPGALNVFWQMEYMAAFYVLGIFLGKEEARSAIKAQRLLPVVMVASASYALGVYWGRTGSHGREYALASLPACLAGILLVIAISQCVGHISDWLVQALAGLGAASMTVFVLHILVGAGARILLSRLGVRDACLHIALGTLAGTMIPYGIHQIFKRYRLLVPLGLAPLRTVRREQLPITQ